MAIGGESRHILRSLVAQFQRTVALGLLAGVGGAAALSQLLRRELYGLSTFDPLSYVGAVALFLCVNGLAALVPARRALRVYTPCASTLWSLSVATSMLKDVKAATLAPNFHHDGPKGG